METMQKWVDYYLKTKVWVCPFSDRSESYYKEWKRISSNTEYNLKAINFNWTESAGIALIAGKKGCIVIAFAKDEELSYSKESLKKVLSILSLPEDYEWVVEDDYHYGIIIDTFNLPSGNIKKKYRDLYIYWEDYYCLPPGNNYRKSHFKNGIPQKHPIQIEWNNLYSRICEIDKFHLLVDSYVTAQREKRALKMKIIMGIVLILFIGVLTGILSVIENLDFTTWVAMFITTLLFAGGIIYMMSH